MATMYQPIWSSFSEDNSNRLIRVPTSTLLLKFRMRCLNWWLIMCWQISLKASTPLQSLLWWLMRLLISPIRSNWHQLWDGWVKITVSEELLGLYCISAQSIVSAMKDAFCSSRFLFSKASWSMLWCITGAKTGVAAKIKKIEPRAVFTHCYGHALNLSVSDTIKQSPAMKNCLDTSFELVKLIKFSPKPEVMLCELKEVGSYASSVHTLCPTRWTDCAVCLASILANW